MRPTLRAVRALPEGKLSRSLCPACRQAREKFANGVVELRGEAWKEKREQVERTIRNSERIARSRNDQERLLWSSAQSGTLKFYVSLPELARRIGRELERAFHGQVEYVRSPEEPYLRVRWWSDGIPEKLGTRTGRVLRGRGKK